MQKSQVVAAIEATPKGANIIVEWVREAKTFKGVSEKITKSVRMVGRMGIDYDNMASVQAKRESGELPAENQGLKWGFWVTFPYLIGFNKGMKKENPDGSRNEEYYKVLPTTAYYLRLYNGTSDKVKPDVHFFVNSVEVDKTELFKREKYLLASEKESEHGDCFTCKVEDMTRIHSESEWVTVVVGQIGQVKIATEEPIPAKVLATLANV